MLWPSRSDAGPYVTEEKATECSTAWACGSLIARSIAMMPAKVMAARGPDESDGSETLPDHPVYGLMQREANPDLSAFRWREGTLLSAIFTGSAYSEIERDQMGASLRCGRFTLIVSKCAATRPGSSSTKSATAQPARSL